MLFGHCHGCGYFVSFKASDIHVGGKATCYRCGFLNTAVHECKEAPEGRNSLECLDCGEWTPTVALKGQPRKATAAI